MNTSRTTAFGRILSVFIAVATLGQSTSAHAEEQEFDFLNNATLLKHGATLGIGPVVLITQRLGNNFTQDDVGFTAMPYVLLHPAYWHRPEQEREYCASKSVLLDADAAQDRADASARLATAKVLGIPVDTVTDQQVADTVRWKVGYRAKCFLKQLGLYAGFPIGYEGSFENADGHKRTRAVTTRGSFGLAWAPVAYINVLAGLSRVAVSLPEGDEESRLSLGWAYTLGIGGTIDVFAALFD